MKAVDRTSSAFKSATENCSDGRKALVVFTTAVLLAMVSDSWALSTCDSWKQLANEMRTFENHTGFITCEAVNCSGVNCAGYLQV
jgi:hypothetical protein